MAGTHTARLLECRSLRADFIESIVLRRQCLNSKEMFQYIYIDFVVYFVSVSRKMSR